MRITKHRVSLFHLVPTVQPLIINETIGNASSSRSLSAATTRSAISRSASRPMREIANFPRKYADLLIRARLRARLTTALLLLQVAKLPIFRADRRFVGGVSNSNYVANGAPTERYRPTFAKVSHPETTLFGFPGLCDDDDVETSRRSRFCAPVRVTEWLRALSVDL